MMARWPGKSKVRPLLYNSTTFPLVSLQAVTEEKENVFVIRCSTGERPVYRLAGSSYMCLGKGSSTTESKKRMRTLRLGERPSDDFRGKGLPVP